jgi:hypothetical protein
MFSMIGALVSTAETLVCTIIWLAITN